MKYVLYEKQKMFENRKIWTKLLVVLVAFTILSAVLAAPPLIKSWKTGTGEVIQKAGDEFLKKPKSEHFISAKDLNEIIDDNGDGTAYGDGDNKSNDPLIIDVRPLDEPGSSHDHCGGFIPGAVLLDESGYNHMAEPENLDELDELLAGHIEDGGAGYIVVHCNSGHTAGLVTGIWGTMGYDVRNQKYGFWADGGWTKDKKGKSTGYPIDYPDTGDYDCSQVPG